MRIVHPTRRRCEREGRDEPDDSSWLVIIDSKVYFTRCKKCAQAEPVLLLKACAVKLVVHSCPGKQLAVGALLDDAPTLDYNDSICANHRG